MRIVLIFSYIILLNVSAFATAQAPDRIIYKGKEYSLFSNPLERYFEQHPESWPNSGMISTGLWRGYIATFEIRDNQLYVKDIEIQISDTTGKNEYDTKWVSVLNEVFPSSENLKVDWFTGLLVIPYGDLKNYVHMGYASTYKNYILLEINTGNLTKEKRYKHKEYEKFKDRQFQLFKQTEEYQKMRADMMKDGSSEEFVNSFLRIYVIEYTSKILAV